MCDLGRRLLKRAQHRRELRGQRFTRRRLTLSQSLFIRCRGEGYRLFLSTGEAPCSLVLGLLEHVHTLPGEHFSGSVGRARSFLLHGCCLVKRCGRRERCGGRRFRRCSGGSHGRRLWLHLTPLGRIGIRRVNIEVEETHRHSIRVCSRDHAPRHYVSRCWYTQVHSRIYDGKRLNIVHHGMVLADDIRQSYSPPSHPA
jgi:hypothetical protein